MGRSVKIIMAIIRHKRSLYILIAETLEVMPLQAFKTIFSLLPHLLLKADEILKGSIADVLSQRCGFTKQYEHYETSYDLFQWPSLKIKVKIKLHGNKITPACKDAIF